MRNQEQYNFLLDLSSSDINYFRRIVTDCVLATDLAKTMTWLSNARMIMIEKSEKSENPLASSDEIVVDEKSALENKILRMQLAIKCGDVGHPARSLGLHLEWSRRISEEFFNQGDLERSQGVKLSPLCDRNALAKSYPQGQIGFINFVCKPVFSLLSAVCKSVGENEKPWLGYLDSNVQYWEEKKSHNVEVNAVPSTVNGEISSNSHSFVNKTKNVQMLSSDSFLNNKKRKSIMYGIPRYENKVTKPESVIMHLCFVSFFFKISSDLKNYYYYYYFFFFKTA